MVILLPGVCSSCRFFWFESRKVAKPRIQIVAHDDGAAPPLDCAKPTGIDLLVEVSSTPVTSSDEIAQIIASRNRIGDAHTNSPYALRATGGQSGDQFRPPTFLRAHFMRSDWRVPITVHYPYPHYAQRICGLLDVANDLRNWLKAPHGVATTARRIIMVASYR